MMSTGRQGRKKTRDVKKEEADGAVLGPSAKTEGVIDATPANFDALRSEAGSAY